MPMLRSRPEAARQSPPGGDQAITGIGRWRCPAAPRIKSAVLAAVGAVAAIVFFPAWFGVPVAAALVAWSLGLVVRGASAELLAVDGLLVLRVGWITRRVAFADITAVLVDKSKVSVARAGGGEISLYAWRKSRLDGWLGVPVVAADIGHAVASAVALAKDGREAGSESADPPPARAGTSARTRSALAAALLGATGAGALVAAFLVRLSWPNPVMTVLSVVLAVVLGITGLFYVIFTLWLILPRRSA